MYVPCTPIPLFIHLSIHNTFLSAQYLLNPLKYFIINSCQMFITGGWCEELLTQVCRLMVNVTVTCLLSFYFVTLIISPLPLEGLSLDCGYMFTLVTITMTQPYRFKVKLTADNMGLSNNSCLLNITPYPWKVFH